MGNKDKQIADALRVAKRATKERAPAPYFDPNADWRIKRGVLNPNKVDPNYGAEVKRWRGERGAMGREGSYDPWSDPENIYTHPTEERHAPDDPLYHVSPEEFKRGALGRKTFALKDGGRAKLADGGDPAAAVRNFVTKAYENILGHDPDSDGLSFWTNALSSGKIDPNALLTTFREQPQARQHAQNAVQNLFTTNLGRPADEEGLNYWTSQLLSGRPVSEVQSVIAQSPEAKAYTAEQNEQTKDYIAQEFEYLTGRSPDPEGLKFWTGQLEKGASFEDISNAIASSEEAQNYLSSNFEPYQVAGKTVRPRSNQTMAVNQRTDELMRSQPLEVQLATLLVQEGEQYLNNLTPDNIKELAAIGYTPFTRAAAEFAENPGTKNFFPGWFRTHSSRDPSAQILAPSAYSSMKSPAPREARRGFRIAEDVVNNPESPINKAALDIARGIINRQIPNPTPGATNYLNPHVYKKQPDWTRTLAGSKIGTASDIGKHVYYTNPQYSKKIEKNFDVAFAPDYWQSQPAAAKDYGDVEIDPALKPAPAPTPAPTPTPASPFDLTRESLFDQMLPPPPPPPANYEEAMAQYRQAHANWSAQVRNWQIMDAVNNNGRPAGGIPAPLLAAEPRPPNPADYGSPGGGTYAPPPPAPAPSLQPINQGAGTTVPGGSMINPGGGPIGPAPAPAPAPVPGPTGSTWTPQPAGQGAADHFASMQNMIQGNRLADQFSGVTGSGGGIGMSAPSGLPSYGSGMTAGPSSGFGVSYMNKGGSVDPHVADALRIARKSGGGAWTRKEGKSESGGLNEKGRASLRAQGHDIKRPQPEGGSRRDSFCARSAGQMKMFPEAAKDPNSRLRKARRKWNCADGGAIDDALRLAKGGDVWDKPRPKSLGKPDPLSKSQKRSAKDAAKAAGRPYPNLVDNLRAAQRKK